MPQILFADWFSYRRNNRDATNAFEILRPLSMAARATSAFFGEEPIPWSGFSMRIDAYLHSAIRAGSVLCSHVFEGFPVCGIVKRVKHRHAAQEILLYRRGA